LKTTAATGSEPGGGPQCELEGGRAAAGNGETCCHEHSTPGVKHESVAEHLIEAAFGAVDDGQQQRRVGIRALHGPVYSNISLANIRWKNCNLQRTSSEPTARGAGV